jgi:predicted nucleotidyltransferase
VAVPPELDVERILRVLTSHGVDFVVIGGVAAVLHGSAIFTQDVDVCFASDETNLVALGKALLELDARLRGVDDDIPFVPDAGTLRRVQLLTLDTSAGPLDVHVQPAGSPPYGRLRRNAERVDLGSFAVLIASVDDLIAMKRAVGRAKDMIAVEELEAIARIRPRIER